MFVDTISNSNDDSIRKLVTTNVTDFSGLLNFKFGPGVSMAGEQTQMPAINGSWVDPSAWSAGSGTDGLGELTDGGWNIYGDVEENLREYDTDPFGGSSIIWKAFDSSTGTDPYDGGFDYGQGPIDPTKKYRFSMFVKTRNVDGDATNPRVYFGPARRNGNHPVYTNDEQTHNNGTNGAENTNPYFFANEVLPTQDEWYLAVGYIYPAGTTTPITLDRDAGLYAMDGRYYIDYTDSTFMFDSDNLAAGVRGFMYNNPSNAGDEAWFWGPRIDEVNGNEASIDELLRIHPGFRMVLQDYTAPASQAQAFNINFNASGVPYTVQPSNDFHSEEVGDGWYRISDYAVANSNLVAGDQISPILYPFDSVGSWADTSSYATKEATYIMRPMIEIVAKDAPKLSPPTAYQRVSGADWPSVSAIPYHHVQKIIELTLDDETSPTNTYRAKAWWDGGQLYHYGNLSGNQEVAIEHIEDGWFKFRNSVKGLLRGEGAVEGDIASMTFGFGDYSGVPYGKALFSAPILANTGSEKSGEVNYSVGTTVPGKNDVANIIDWVNGGPGYIVSGTEVSSISVVNHTTPNGTSAILVHTDEAGANRDDLWFESTTFHTRASNYDTTVAQVPVKSLWNYNELPYTRNILDDPGFNYEGDVNGNFYSLNELQYPIDETDKGPDGVSQALTFYNEHPSLGTRQFFDVGALSYIPSSTLHAWDENLVVNFSIHLKRPDNVEDTVPRFLLYLSDHTDPENTQGIYFDWGPSSTHPYHYSNNHQYKQVTFTDAGDGWYRVCWSVSGFGDDPNQKVHNGDKVSFRVFAMDSLGKSIKYAQPQIEFHTINDTNLLKPSWDWYETDGAQGTSVNGWALYGANNKISLREDPFGLSSLCVAGFDNNTNDGGIVDYPLVSIDSSSTYRYSFFMRFVDTSADTRVLFGPNSYNTNTNPEETVRRFDGAIESNPFFYNDFRYSNIGDDWVLIVAHLHDSSESFPITNHPDTGVYRMDGTEIPFGIYDFASSSVTTTQGGRIFSIGSTDDNGREIFQIWSPRIEKVDGTEPSITELLASGNLWTNPNYQQTLPSPYVENVGYHPNPHRHNWLVATEDLDNTAYWARGNRLTVEASTVQTTYANGETCFIMRNGSEADQYGYIRQNQYQNNIN